jgi:hypothetical protein
MQELGRRDVYTPQVTPRQDLDGGEGSVVRWGWDDIFLSNSSL